MTRRRWIGLTAAGLVGILAIAGCGSPAPSAGSGAKSNDAAPSGITASRGGTALRMVAADYGGATKQYWSTVVTGFEKTHPGVTVDLQLIPWKDIDAKVSVMVKNNQVPDLLQSGSYASLANSGQLYQAQDVLDEATRDDLVDTLKTAGSIGGIEYGIPFAARTHLLVYNKDLFDRVGLSAPKTWQDIVDAATALRGRVELPYGMALSASSAQGSADDAATAEAAQWMLGNGAMLTDGDGQLAIGGTLEADALSWMRTNLVDAGLAGKNPAALTETALTGKFAAGRVGMMSADPAAVRKLTTAKTAGKPVDWGVVVMPGRGSPLPKTLTTNDWIVAFKKNGNQDEIKQFLDYAYEPAQQTALTSTVGLLPTTGQGRDAVAADPTQAGLAPWLTALRTTTTYPAGALAWPGVESVLRQGVGKAVTGGQTAPTDVVDRVKQSIQETQAESTDT